MGVQMYVSLSVGMWRANEIQTPAQILMKFCTHIPTCPGKDLTPALSPLGLGGQKH